MSIIHTAITHDEAVRIAVTAIRIRGAIHAMSEDKARVVLSTTTHLRLATASWIPKIPRRFILGPTLQTCHIQH